MKSRNGNGHIYATWPELDQRVLEYIVDFKTEHCGDSPTIREMMDALGVGSSSTLGALDRLENQGIITRIRTRIAVTGAEWKVDTGGLTLRCAAS